MKRVAVYVDGFNLYHALRRMPTPQAPDKRLRWLDLMALSRRLLRPRDEQLVKVTYFSAYADWMPAERRRHETYVAALEAQGVTMVMGHFKNKDRRCPSCGHRWQGHEEKETDVNIALHMLTDAWKDVYDTALIVTRDSDMKPAFETVRRDFPHKEMVTVAPPMMGFSRDLSLAASSQRKITPDQVKQCRLPDRIVRADGAVIHCPTDYL
jgi:uncharacterized LabA/DUF88 family protein